MKAIYNVVLNPFLWLSENKEKNNENLFFINGELFLK